MKTITDDLALRSDMSGAPTPQGILRVGDALPEDSLFAGLLPHLDRKSVTPPTHPVAPKPNIPPLKYVPGKNGGYVSASKPIPDATSRTSLTAQQAGMPRAKGRREDGLYIPLPYVVVRSHNYQSLQPSAVKLFMAMAWQLEFFKGGTRNNGNLRADPTTLKGVVGLDSEEALAKAKQELIERGWIQRTRQGGPHNGADLFAFTMWAIDDCVIAMDVPPTETPSSLWREWEPEGQH